MDKIVYVLLVVFTTISYILTKDTIIDTKIGLIHLSNITLNFVLLFVIVGGSAPWIARKLFPKAKVSIPFTMSCGLTLLFIMSLLGYVIKPSLVIPLLFILIISYLWTGTLILRAQRNG